MTDAQTPGEAPAKTPQVNYSLSAGLTARLARAGISLAFTSYQSGLLYCLGRDQKGAHLHQAGFPKPMGLAVTDEGSLLLSAGYHLFRLENVLEPEQRINHTFDACFVPREIHLTGQLDAHDIAATGAGELIFVNTRFNCLARPSRRHSFEVVWRPPFISALADEDRCHLNGLAMEQGEAAYVTAVSRSDTIDGWRDRRTDGGVVVDVRRNQVICEGLSMPHSPRLHQGELWVLNAGTGDLGVVAMKDGKGRFEPRVFCPGFLRGLAFHGNYAFVGLSKPRYQRFEGLALDSRLKERDSEPWCGLQVIDLSSGACVDWFRIDGDVAEIYDIAVLPEFACPMTLSPNAPDAATLITYSGLKSRS